MKRPKQSEVMRRRDAALAELLTGQVLNGFEIKESIGSGGMGTVFRARQLSVNRDVAVKVIRDDGTPQMRERFVREARLISGISHPNLVQLIDFGHREDLAVLYYAMELIEGWSLSSLLRQGRLHPNLVIELMIQICSALAEAHAKGVVHRDLKASNMLLSLSADSSIRLRVLDFGIAKSFEDTENLTQAGVLCGTPAYMAPEQARGAPPAASMDLYAAGINLFYMIKGEVPFGGGSAIQVAVKQLQLPVPSLEDYVERGFVPRSLAELCVALLAKDPAERPKSAGEVRARLLEIRAEYGWTAIALSPPTEAALMQYVGLPLPRETGQPAASWAAIPTSGAAPATAPADTSGPVLERSGGGWDAFNQTTPAPDGAEAALVLSPVTGEFMSTPDETSPLVAAEQQAHKAKPAPVPRTRVAPGRRFTDEELVPDRPEPPVVETRPRPKSSSNDATKLMLVAVVAFIVCAGLAFVMTSDEPSPAPPATESEPMETAEPAEPPEPAEKPRKKKAKKSSKKSKDEPIDLFEGAPEDPADKPPIIIEEGP